MISRINPVYQDDYLAPIFRKFGRRFVLPPLVFVGLYWILPLLFLVASQVVRAQRISLAEIGDLYLSDYVHHLFALNSAILVFFCYRFVRLLHFRMTDILRNSPGHGIPLNICIDFKKVTRTPFSAVGYLAAGLLAALCCYMLGYRVYSDSYTFWWGNIAHGYAGVAYTAVTTVLLFLFAQYFFLLGALTGFLVRFSSTTMRLRPYFPDGVSGLGRFAAMMISVWAQTILLSLALLIVVQSNYLSLTNNFFVWLLGGIIVIVAPFAAVMPFSTTVLRARKLKRQMIDRAIKSEFIVETPCNKVTFSDLKSFAEAKAKLDAIVVFPFLSIRFAALVIFNLIQMYLAVATILSGFSVAG